MNDDLTLRVRLMATTNEYVAGLGRAASSTRAFAQQTETFVQRNQKMISMAGKAALVMGGALALGLNKAEKAATGLSKEMANIATLIPGQTARVYELRDGVQELAVGVGKSTSDITGGLYQVVSAFGDTADSIGILEVNARAARAGLATTTDAIDLTSAVTKGYGDTSAEAVEKAADLALMTVRMGQTTFPELAASIGRVTPLTASLGVAQEELFAVMATGTGVTGGAAEVSTQLRGVMQSLMSPTAGMTELLAEHGYESGKAMLADLGLQGAIAMMVDTAEEAGVPLQDYISSIEGQTLAMALAGPQADVFTEKIEAMGGAAGTSDEAFEAMTEGIGRWAFNAEQAAAQQEVALQKIGEAVAPVKGAMMGFFADVAEGFSNLSPSMQENIAKGGMVAAAFGLVGGTALIAVPKILAFKTAVAASGMSLDGLRLRAMYMAPAIGRMIPVIGALVVAWQQHAERTRDVESASASLVEQLNQEGAVVAEVTAEWVRGEVVRRNLAGDLQAAGVPIEMLTSALMGNGEALNAVNDRLNDNVSGWDKFQNTILPTSLFPSLAAGSSQLSSELRILHDAANQAAVSQAYLGDVMDTPIRSFTDIGPRIREAAAATDAAGTSAGGAAPQVGELGEEAAEAESAFEALAPSILAAVQSIASGMDPMSNYQTRLEEINSSNRSVAESTAAATESSKDSWDDYFTETEASYAAYRESLTQTLTEQREWHANLNKIREVAGAEYADMLAAQGPEQAGLHAEIAAQEAGVMREGAAEHLAIRNESLQASIDAIIRATPSMVDKAGVMGSETVDEIAKELGTTRGVVEGAIANSIPALEQQFRAMQAASGQGAASTVAAMAFELGKGTAEADRIVNTWANVTGQNLNPLLMMVGKEPIPMFARKLLAGARLEGGFGLLPQEALIQSAKGPQGLIQWAEAGTGGEAYIPLAPTKRNRSIKIWEETGRRLGIDPEPTAFAAGGINVPDSPSFAPLSHPLSTTGTAAIDYTKAAVEKWIEENQAPAVGSAPGVDRMMAALRQVFPGLALISGLRPGAITATGNPSWHAKGRAVDIPPRMDVFDHILKNYGHEALELIFSPAGGRQRHRGRPHVYTGITKSMHYDHIHWAALQGMIRGGDGASLYDQGGILPPGSTMAQNNTGSNEIIAAQGMIRAEVESGIRGAMPQAPRFAGSSTRLDPDEYRRRVEINNRLFELGITSLTAHLENLERRMLRTVPFSAEWMSLFEERKRLVDGLLEDHMRSVEEAQANQDSALADLNQLLDERNRISDQIADQMQRREEGITRLIEQRNAERLRIEEQFNEERERILRTRADALFNALPMEERATRQWANSISAILRNEMERATQREDWAEGLDLLRGMGLSEDAIAAFGLSDLTEESLAKVQLWSQSTEAEIAALNAAIAERQRFANETAATEAEQQLGSVGEQLIGLTERTSEEMLAVQAAYRDSMLELLHDTFARIQDLNVEQRAIGKDEGRSWSEAVAEGIDSGIPAITGAVERLNAARMLTLRAGAQLEEAKETAAANPAAGGSASIAPLGHHYLLPDGRHALRLSNQAWYVATGPGQRSELQRLYGPPTPHPDIQADRILGSLVSLFGAGGMEQFASAQIQPKYFDRGGWLPPNSVTLAANATSSWEPVGQTTHAVSAVAGQERVVQAIQQQTRIIQAGIDAGQVIVMDGREVASAVSQHQANQGDDFRLRARRGRAAGRM